MHIQSAAVRSWIVLVALLVMLAGQAEAWSRPGHMVTAAIAYADLATGNPAVIERIAAILAGHPDRAAFDVAVDRATGEEHARRLIMECARWPDDARDTPFDHPTWHYASRPVVRDTPAPPPTPGEASGQAIEALELNFRVAVTCFPFLAPTETGNSSYEGLGPERKDGLKKTRFSEAQIAFILKQAEDGTNVGEVCRKAGISQATFYNWRNK